MTIEIKESPNKNRVIIEKANSYTVFTIDDKTLGEIQTYIMNIVKLNKK